MSAGSATYVLEARNARAMPLTIELRAGVTLDPLSIGRNGTWLLDAAGVLMQHAFLYFDGEELFVQSIDPHVPVVTAKGPIPTRWTRVAAPCTLVFGAGSIVFAKVEREASDEENSPDTVPGEPPSAVVAPSLHHDPDSERTEVGPPPRPLAHLASTLPIFEMSLKQQPTGQPPPAPMPSTERLPRVAASPPAQPAPAFEPKPPPWPPPAPAMLHARPPPPSAYPMHPQGTLPLATARPGSAPPPEFKPIDPAGPDDATMYAPIVQGAPVPTVGAVGAGPYGLPTPGPMVVPLQESQPPAGGRALQNANPLAAWWTAAPLPRKLLALLVPIAVALAVLSLLADREPSPAPRAKGRASASAKVVQPAP